MRYGSVQNAEIHLFCSENRNFLLKNGNNITVNPDCFVNVIPTERSDEESLEL